MKVLEAKEKVLPLIMEDIEFNHLELSIDESSPDGDPGKFSVKNLPARVIHPRDGFYVKINRDWILGSNELPKINNTNFYWYIFTLRGENINELSSYFICDYQQLREWVIGFDAPQGDTYENQSTWRGDIIILDEAGKKGYFRWGDEDPDLRLESRYIDLRNISSIIGPASDNLSVGQRNPNWTTDEVILALDLYFSLPSLPSSESHPDIIALSNILRSLPIHKKSEVAPNFRNPSGVYMKLMNFLSLDPDYEGVGLEAASQLDRFIWDQYNNDREGLHEVAIAIKNNFSEVTESSLQTTAEEEFREGRILTRVHKDRERNHTLISKKKTTVLHNTGRLACEVCGFDFHYFYGEIGKAFAECHHKTPISELDPNTTTKQSDLAILCANCHRMIHRSSPMFKVSELRNLLMEKGSIN